MASPIIACPECKKKFKGKDDLLGKKIRCPFCKKPFVVEEASTGGGKADKKVAETATVAAAGETDDEFEEGSNPYGVTQLDLAPRCPNCANEMESEEAVVCLFCGYNTLTRAWGKTAKVLELTFRDYFLHLLPGLLSVLLIVLLIAGVVYYCLVLPDVKKWGWLEFVTDHESTRMWISAIVLGITWGFGYFAFNRLILHTKPPDKVKQ
jgi:hypothetical protein